MKNCAVCGKEFQSPYSIAMYCSEACKKVAHRKAEAKRYELYRGALTDKACKVCGTQFTPRQRNTLYCSDRCRRQHSREHPGHCREANASDFYQVTTPYGSHAFDSFVAKHLGGARHAAL